MTKKTDRQINECMYEEIDKMNAQEMKTVDETLMPGYKRSETTGPEHLQRKD